MCNNWFYIVCAPRHLKDGHNLTWLAYKVIFLFRRMLSVFGFISALTLLNGFDCSSVNLHLGLMSKNLQVTLPYQGFQTYLTLFLVKGPFFSTKFAKWVKFTESVIVTRLFTFLQSVSPHQVINTDSRKIFGRQLIFLYHIQTSSRCTKTSTFDTTLCSYSPHPITTRKKFN
jgi:hypothetical protein